MANEKEVGFEIEGLNQFLRTMRAAPKELQKEVRQASKVIAETVAVDARARARRANPQLAAAAPSIRAVQDRIPKIRYGGAKRATSTKGTTAGDIIFGADFGSRRYRQFPAVKKGGRAIWPAVEANRRRIADEWLDAVETVFMDRGV